MPPFASLLPHFALTADAAQRQRLVELSHTYAAVPAEAAARKRIASEIAHLMNADAVVGPLAQQIRGLYRQLGLCLLPALPDLNLNVLLAIPATAFDLLEIQRLPLDTRVTPESMVRSPLYRQQELNLHTDFPFDPPHSTTIFCVQQDPHYPDCGVSLLLDADVLVDHLRRLNDPELLQVAFTMPFSHLNFKQQSELSPAEPILTAAPEHGGHHVRYNRTYMRTRNGARCETALDRFEAEIRQLAQRYALATGDMLILNNRRLLHGRTDCTIEHLPDGSFRSRSIFTVWGNHKEDVCSS